jgi:hypothetical protein
MMAAARLRGHGSPRRGERKSAADQNAYSVNRGATLRFQVPS